jgi:hypothetical protein
MEFVEGVGNSLIHPFGNVVTVVQDRVMGRCLVANKSFEAGEVIFQDEALFFGSCDDDVDYIENLAFAYLKTINPKLKLSAVKKFVVAMAEDDEVESLDTARSFLHGICIADKFARCGSTSEQETLRMELLKMLQPSKLEENIEVIQNLRRAHKSIIPQGISDAIAGRLLGKEKIINKKASLMKRT